jgi:hypothetical protein
MLTNFTSGYISPLVEGQIDLKQYYNGGRVSRNMVPLPHGPLKKRGGTAFVAETKNVTGNHRLIPFQFNITQSYVIEIGDQYMRFFSERGQIYSSNQPYEISSPYLSADIPEINFTQSADVLILVHPNYPPHELLRYGHTDWVLREISFDSGPFLPDNMVIKQYKAELESDRTTGDTSFDITVSIEPEVDFILTLSETIAGVHEEYEGAISAVTHVSGSTYTVTVPALTADFTTKATTHARPTDAELPKKPYWGSQSGYPSVVTFFEQRLLFANSPAYPQTIWCSVIGIYYDFTVQEESTDDDAIIYTIASDQVNGIRWLLPQSVVLIGTKGGEFKFSSSVSGEAITPSNVKCVRQTNHGSSPARPVLLENSALFVQFGGRKVRNISYDLLNDVYEAEDITILAEDITKSRIVQTAYQNNPDSIFWANVGDGRLIGCTVEKKQNVIAWHDHVIAGLDSVVESIANIDSDSGDELWMIVKRTINGSTVKYVEYLADQLRSSVPEVDRAYTDSYLKNVFETPTTTVTGLEHLEGEIVKPVVDNWVHPDVVVTNGSVTLQEAGSKIVIGLPYTAQYKSMRVQVRVTEQITYHMEKRIVRAWISLYESLGISVGPEGGNIADQLIGEPRVMGKAQEYVTKDVEVNLDGQTSTDARLVLESREPLPLTVLSIVFDLEVSSL